MNATATDGFLAWTGGYTESMGGSALGIGRLGVRPSGELVFDGVVATMSSPSYLARAGSVLYAADEAEGRVAAFRIEAGNALTPLGSLATSGAHPCHLSVAGRMLLAANYGDGSVDVFSLHDDGSLLEHVQRLPGEGSGPLPQQDGPHAHSTLVLPSGGVLSADLGADRVYLHDASSGRLWRTGHLELPPGTGPRDLLLLGDRVLLLGEFGSRIHEIVDGQLVRSGELVTDAVPGDQAAGLAVGPGGRFLYAGLRGSNRIAVVDAHSLVPVAAVSCEGDWPRHLTVVDGLLLVSNQLSGTVSRFELDAVSGLPRLLERPAMVPSPTFLLP
ncbi:6-phosphogluconolactonase (cycloisomerase 2 family) [Homoserinimonas aerilata]|uniref:6-phosphogluconolactonase (Cycloisomerase 2 family) n=1 Tax=Homoserinimonas aerilata TaxID=1162970 RepID=A0A542YIG4_9MICO|nr:beta-propeller fold lactonase family protein [Homoserinimonas aerilata]TQL47868.1 6-phosphogluconolactonase (cycloisomerase 2 family) [Homoserinimonas aerilata]